MEHESLEDRLARLERERTDADRAYNTRLTEVDRALPQRPEFPHHPPAYDETQVPSLNGLCDILPAGEPAVDGSFMGRLRAFVWKLVGPPLATQKRFNTALVDHVNRNVTAHREAQRAIASTIALAEEQTRSLIHFHAALLSLLQSVTLYVDTKDRSVAGQHQVLNAAVGALTDDWLKHWESQGIREDSLMRAYQELSEKASLVQQSVLLLKREVNRMSPSFQAVSEERGRSTAVPAPNVRPEQRPAGRDNLSSFNYVGFEERFRGSQAEIRGRLADYVPLFAGATNVVDLGCGRGELLNLLRESGISAYGIDVNASMVEVCLEGGLDARTIDAVSHLETLSDGTLGGIVAIQLVEHLDPPYLTTLIGLAHQKLAPGAALVLETLNPACWLAFFESYIRDVTHRWPLHPDTLRYLVQAAGFSAVSVEFRSPVSKNERLQQIPPPTVALGTEPDPLLIDLLDVANANTEKLNARLFTFMDYAVVARR